jgi:hypothetical protein
MVQAQLDHALTRWPPAIPTPSTTSSPVTSRSTNLSAEIDWGLLRPLRPG